MANVSVTTASGEVVGRGTLTAATIDTVTFDRDLEQVEVAADGTAEVYFTLDGSDPGSGANKASYRLPASGGWNSLVVDVSSAGNTTVKLKSTGTPKYEVTKG